jgi:hypothetical protein
VKLLGYSHSFIKEKEQRIGVVQKREEKRIGGPRIKKKPGENFVLYAMA